MFEYIIPRWHNNYNTLISIAERVPQNTSFYDVLVARTCILVCRLFLFTVLTWNLHVLELVTMQMKYPVEFILNAAGNYVAFY